MQLNFLKMQRLPNKIRTLLKASLILLASCSSIKNITREPINIPSYKWDPEETEGAFSYYDPEYDYYGFKTNGETGRLICFKPDDFELVLNRCKMKIK